MAVHNLSLNDHAALHEAADLVKTVCDRHPLQMTMPILSHLQYLLREIGVIEALLDAA